MDEQAVLEANERRIVAAIFKWGLSLSSLAMVAGYLIEIATGRAAGESVDLAHLGNMSLSGALMGAGIGILAATPAVNVGTLMILWARRRQFKLSLIALTVMLTLVAAMRLGQG